MRLLPFAVALLLLSGCSSREPEVQKVSKVRKYCPPPWVRLRLEME